MAQRLLVVGSGSSELKGLERQLDELGIDYRVGASDETTDAAYVLTLDGDVDPSVVETLWKRRSEAELWMVSRVPSHGIANRIYRRVLDLPYYDYGAATRLYDGAALKRGGATLDRPSEALLQLHSAGYKVKELKSRATRHSRPSLFALPRLRRLRKHPPPADADDRAYTSRAPLRAKWLKKRYQIIVSYLEVDVPWLGVGFGSSRLVQTLAKGTCVDLDVRKLRYLRGRVKRLAAAEPAKLPFLDESFPQLACGDVAVASSLTELRRVLKPGGTLVLTASDPSSWTFQTLRPLRGWVGPALGEAPNLLTRGQLEGTLQEHGFRIDAMKRVFRSEWVVRAVRGH